MAHPLLIQIRPDTDGGWRVAVGDGRSRAAEGTLTPDQVIGARERIQRALASSSPVLVRGRDASRSRAEEQAGSHLSALLTAAPELAARWAWLLGRAAGQHQLALVVIDATEPTARALPWELLAGPEGPPLEESGSGVVLRLAPATPPPALEPRRGLDLRLWCAEPKDPTCAARIGALRSLADRLGLRLLEGPGEAEEGREVLWVIGHGERVADGVCLALEDADQGPGTAAHALGPAVRQAGLVVLDVCEAGCATPGELDALATRLMTSGARACAGPLIRAGLEAADAFASGLVVALLEGADAASATAAGRREVRALALPHPDCRWANHALWISDVAVLDTPLVRVERRPTGWPRPGPVAAELVGEAVHLATAAEGGFIGVEHLLAALGQASDATPSTAALRFALSRDRELWRRHLVGLSLDASRPTELLPSPRLTRLGWWLPDGFDLEALWSELAREPGDLLGHLLGPFPTSLPTGESTLKSATWGWDSGFQEEPVAVEVLGGPEDGRRLRLGPGESLGRASTEGGPDHGLYQTTRLVDPYLSRRHMRWDGASHVTALRPLVRVRGGDQRKVSTTVEVKAGDVLTLTDATSLRLLGAAALGG